MMRRVWHKAAVVLAGTAAAFVCTAVVANGHTSTPEEVVAQLSRENLTRVFAIVRVERDPALARLLVIRVDRAGWEAVEPSLREQAAGDWMHLWRTSVPSGIIAIVDAQTEESLVGFDALGRPQLASPRVSPPAPGKPGSDCKPTDCDAATPDTAAASASH